MRTYYGKLFFVFIFLMNFPFIMAQNSDYDSSWNQIDTLFSKGKLKSASPLLDKIYSQAKQNGDTPHLLKALMYQSNIAIVTQDDEDISLEIAQKFQQEMVESKGAQKAILESLLAELYFNYWSENSYKINGRTAVADDVSQDFRTWSAKRFSHVIDSLLQASVQIDKNWAQQPIQSYEILLEKEEKWQFLSPWLIDVLTYRAVDIYGNYVFQNSSSKENSAHQKVQTLLRNLVKLHQNDKDKSALVEAELRLLKHKIDHQGAEDNSLAYQALYEKYNDTPWAANILFEMAQEKSYGENPDYTQVVALCEKAISEFPNSFGAKKCQQLIESVSQPQLSFDADATFLADAYNPLYIHHQNVDEIYYRIYRVSLLKNPELSGGFNYDYQNQKFDLKGKPFKEGAIELKKFTDYKSHSTVFPLEPLPAGNYILLLANNKDFNGKENHQIYQGLILSTQIDLTSRTIYTENGSRKTEFQAVDKQTGKPLANQTAQIWRSNNKAPFQKYKSVNTDEYGLFKSEISNAGYHQNFLLSFANEQTVFPFYSRDYVSMGNEKEWENHIVYFTDRAIYRPGQTVHFKAILYQSKGKERRIVPNQEIEILLDDVNGEEVGDVELVSNEFGSVHGSFVLPNSGLTGSFDLWDDWSDSGFKQIKVEEYKRPTFKVEIDSLQGAYQFNDTVAIAGKALTFSGAPLTDAKVRYRVTKQAYFPYGYWRYPNVGSQEEIAHGETTTDANGAFLFDFVAKNETKENRFPQAYRYKIHAEVIDLSGETQVDESVVNIGEIPLQISLEVPARVDEKEFHSLKINSKNLNGVFVPAKGTLEITEIKPLNKLLRQQQKEIDYPLLSVTEWNQKIPYLAHHNEHLSANREKGKTWISTSWDTQENLEVAWKKQLPAGTYEIKATSLYKGDTLTAVQRIKVQGKKQKSEEKVFFEAYWKKSTLEPGETAQLVLKSDATDAYVLVELEANGKIVSKKLISLKEEYVYSFPVKEAYRGGVFVHTYFYKFNQNLAQTHTLDVPYDNKKLEVKMATRRDKLTPGQAETWSFTVRNHEGDKVMAEMLTSMYDASLDQFVPHAWKFSPFAKNSSQFSDWRTTMNAYFRNYSRYRNRYYAEHVRLPDFQLFGLSLNENRYAYRKNEMPVAMAVEATVPTKNLNQLIQGEAAGVLVEVRGRGGFSAEEEPIFIHDGKEITAQQFGILSEGQLQNVSILKGDEAIALYGSRAAGGVVILTSKNAHQENLEKLSQVEARKNLQETAFFFPDLKTDAEGNVTFSFTLPESLTTWKLQALAHTPSLASGKFSTEMIAQKDLMVVPNAPRFLREGDEWIFKTKIINLSEETQSGNAKLDLINPFDEQSIASDFELIELVQPFTVAPKGNTVVSWRIKVPQKYSVLKYRVVAATDNFSDGEENVLPVLTNRTLVTETMPIHVRKGQKKTFVLDGLKNNTSTTRKDFLLTMEMTTNPVWYAVMALPYLREYPYECSEQVFSRFYANLISQHIVNSNPKIKAVFEDWKRKDELISPLEKNQELKNILLEETPWVRAAQSESEQQKRMALLFDLNQMRYELREAFQKLEQKQSSNGGFPWFQGGRENLAITNHIVAGLGHLQNMEIDFENTLDVNVQPMLKNAVEFVDNQMTEKWNKYQKDKERFPIHLYEGLNWLYARSYFIQAYPFTKELENLKAYVLKSAEKQAYELPLQNQALLALIWHRMGDAAKAKNLLLSIKDHAVESEEMGMYWKENVAGYRWYQAPIETQALLIEAFDEVLNDAQSVEDMKVWLIKNKQTHQWTSTRATTEAVYALLNTGENWLASQNQLSVTVGNQPWYPATETESQSGSGYVKTTWKAEEITPDLAEVKVEKQDAGVAWGAMYWQYFEDLDQVQSANSQLRFRKALYVQKNTDQGPELTPITPQTPIKVGDLVKVRLEIQTDRAMEFVHIKDLRASGFEPVNVLSSYKWQDGLGYYESTRDAATHFFIDDLPKGVYVFEYALRATIAGSFSNGITQMQNMYAPEFSAHSKGMKVEIEE